MDLKKTETKLFCLLEDKLTDGHHFLGDALLHHKIYPPRSTKLKLGIIDVSRAKSIVGNK